MNKFQSIIFSLLQKSVKETPKSSKYKSTPDGSFIYAKKEKENKKNGIK